MKRYDAIKEVVKDLTDELIISNIGIPSKELHEIKESKNNFYMIGSMGMATPIGIGLSIALQKHNDERNVIVLDGDGSILMNLNEFVTLYEANPKNLIVVILDNETYGSTGSQKTYAEDVSLSNIAKSVGINEVHLIDTKNNNDTIDMTQYLNKKEPVILHIKVDIGNSDAPTIKLSPSKIKNRFMKTIEDKY